MFNVDCNNQLTDFDYLVCAVYFEAGNQGEEGMRLVADTILNRANDDKFPDSIRAVLTQRNQFSYWRQKHFKIHYKEEFIKAQIVSLKALLTGSKNKEVLFFHTKQVSKKCRYGTHVITYKNHVFCG